MSYNFSEGDGNWSTSGCIVMSVDEENEVVVCGCSHLTNFGVLVVSCMATVNHAPWGTTGFKNATIQLVSKVSVLGHGKFYVTLIDLNTFSIFCWMCVTPEFHS